MSASATPPPESKAPGWAFVIVKEIIEAHGGKVGVRSEPGVGSRFWFELPQASAAQ